MTSCPHVGHTPAVPRRDERARGLDGDYDDGSDPPRRVPQPPLAVPRREPVDSSSTSPVPAIRQPFRTNGSTTFTSRPSSSSGSRRSPASGGRRTPAARRRARPASPSVRRPASRRDARPPRSQAAGARRGESSPRSGCAHGAKAQNRLKRSAGTPSCPIRTAGRAPRSPSEHDYVTGIGSRSGSTNRDRASSENRRDCV